MAARSLLVVMYDTVVGRIRQNSAAADSQFTYDPQYAATGSTPLSVRVPVADTTSSLRLARSVRLAASRQCLARPR